MLTLLKYLRPYTLTILLALGLLFFHSLTELFLPTLMAEIVDEGVVKGNVSLIIQLGLIMLVVAAFGTLANVFASFFSARVSTGFGRDLRKSLFSHVETFSLQEFDTFGTASLITRTTNDVTQVQTILMIMMRMMVAAPMMAIGGIIMAIYQDAKLSLVIVAAVPVLAISIYLVAKKGLPLYRAMQNKLDIVNRVQREGLTGIRVIRAFNRIAHEENRFNEANLDLTNIAIKVNKIMAAMMPLMMLILNFSTIAIIWFGSIRIDQGDMQIGSLMAFLQYAMQIMFSFIMVSMMFVMIPRAAASASRINEVLQTQPTIVNPEQVDILSHKKGTVEFKNVSFSYPGAERPAISNISFKVNPGEVTAIIGGTGSGKTTLISLIPRFYDVDEGEVLVDGVDVRDMDQEALRSKIGFVPQKSVLFSGTVADNIRYGKEDASDEEVKHAAEVAQALDFINEMKDGFASQIAQGATNLSGGQKQRLSIARALVRKPEIYIFDDSFSALDFKTDAKLRKALRKETAQASVFIVAQRVSTVMDADQIIVLDEGRIVGKGTHRELLETCNVYREIVSSQLSEEESA